MNSVVLETKNLGYLYSKGTSSQVAAINDINLKIYSLSVSQCRVSVPLFLLPFPVPVSSS